MHPRLDFWEMGFDWKLIPICSWLVEASGVCEWLILGVLAVWYQTGDIIQTQIPTKPMEYILVLEDTCKE